MKIIVAGKEFPIVVGRKGVKRDKWEGDGATPLGVFSIGPIFGHAKKAPRPFKMAYLPLYWDTVCVDDPESKYYNQIVRESEIGDRDWSSCERMGEEPLYELGAVIQYNIPPVAGKGSAIFFHLWRDAKSPTAGCIGLSKEDLIEVLLALEPKTKVQIREELVVLI